MSYQLLESNKRDFEMKSIKVIFIAPIFFLLAACSSPGPMQQYGGPINTPVFEPIALDLANDDSEHILFKESNVTMYENDSLERLLGGAFFITENGVYLAYWNAQTYQYSLTYKIKADEITKISDHTVVRDYLPDSDIVVITDKDNREIGFGISKRNAAKYSLEKIMKQNE